MLLTVRDNNLVIHIITYSIRDKLHYRCILRSRSIQKFKVNPSIFLDRKLENEKNPKTVFTIWKNGKLSRLCFFLFSLTVIVTEILPFLSALKVNLKFKIFYLPPPLLNQIFWEKYCFWIKIHTTKPAFCPNLYDDATLI